MFCVFHEFEFSFCSLCFDNLGNWKKFKSFCKSNGNKKCWTVSTKAIGVFEREFSHSAISGKDKDKCWCLLAELRQWRWPLESCLPRQRQRYQRHKCPLRRIQTVAIWAISAKRYFYKLLPSILVGGSGGWWWWKKGATQSCKVCLHRLSLN